MNQFTPGWAVLALVAQLVALPDAALTPGTVRLLSKEEICATKWGLDRRLVSLRMKQHVARAYNIQWAERDQYEFDHLIPRSLGGADDILNLWPQRWAEARKKDAQEVRLSRAMCRNEVSLRAAQTQMRRWGR